MRKLKQNSTCLRVVDKKYKKRSQRTARKETEYNHTWVSATPLDNVVGIQLNIASPVETQKFISQIEKY